MIDEHPVYNDKSNYANLLPDGAITFYEATNRSLKYKAQINDNRFNSYHRKNGITKIGLGGRNDILVVTDGLLGLMDMLHQAYLKHLRSEVQIVTLVQLMPIQFDAQVELLRLLNLLGASLYPIALSLLLPVFMHAIVLEKEEKLQDFMKMNGMRLRNYWLVNFTLGLLVYYATVGLFFLFGATVLDLQFFTQTGGWVVFILLSGWGVAQIALAFCAQVFISKAQTATVWGYLLSV